MTCDIRKFQNAINYLTHQNKDPKKLAKIGLAISGGPDSMALLWLAHNHYDGPICAATVDHGLRSESSQEADYVASLCQHWNIAHQILRPKSPIVGNMQSAARAVRYELLSQWAKDRDCQYIATAHHADDQLETMVMRINRGSGVAGLAGIRPKNGHIIRPLLEYRKTELIALCQSANVRTIDDPSNSNDSFDRVKVRQWINRSESLGQEPLIDAIMAQKTAHNLHHAEMALQYSANILAQKFIQARDGTIILSVSNLPYEYQRRLLMVALKMIDGKIEPRGPALSNLINALNNNNISMIGNIKCVPKINKERPGDRDWILKIAPPRND